MTSTSISIEDLIDMYELYFKKKDKLIAEGKKEFVSEGEERGYYELKKRVNKIRREVAELKIRREVG